jgi:hypothetical protein
MPAPFRRLDAAQFAELIRLFTFTRNITAFHVHHTWIPTRAQFKGLATIEAMERAHRQRGFADIAQHITLDPAGLIWTGRSWNEPPASAKGFNGTRKAGPFMMEMVGNFDQGHEPFDGAQAANAYQVVALVLRQFGLTTDDVVFHREMSDKSCPGTSIDKPTFVKNVQQALDALPALAAASDEERAHDRDLVAAFAGLIEPVARDAARSEDAEAELPENDETYADSRARAVAEADVELADSREAQCPSPAQLHDLVPHVINLRRGHFSADELFISNAGTVDAIFQGLDARAANASAARPLKVVLWAHGGLVGQRSALCKAHRDLWFWQSNENIYPIYFVWHSDLGTALRDILLRWREGRRDVFDFTSDPLIELFVHTFGGVAVWDSMKLSAADASGPDGGARYVAQRLGDLVKKHGANVELHAVGHSAGANFHSHFLPAAVDQKVTFKSLQLLAPAIRTKEFVDRVDALLGKQVKTAKIFTMRRPLERADDCVRIYRKSLLYLISKGLEIKRNEPILGLEDFLTQDAHLRERFGIKVGPKTVGEVIFSKTPGKSEATAHGCFDDDVATMNSVAATILGAPPATSYKNTGAGKCTTASAFESEMEVPRELAGLFNLPPAPQPLVAADRSVWRAATTTVPYARGTGRRRALCVGINGYPTAPLHGCVADAMLWAQTLATLGFDARTLLDAAATRQGILDTLGELLESSLPGDLVVFQFSGHGTEVRDENGDELANKDQALCPYDFNDGHLLIDDDVAELFTKIPAGVGLTCFLDNCHSGTATRFAIGRPDTNAATGDLPRFVVADEELERKHADFRRGTRTASMREVVFSACKPEELAWESSGQGDFTRNAVALLSRVTTLTNEEFQEQLTSGFTPSGRQHPILDCAPAALGSSLFGFGIAATAAAPAGTPTAGTLAAAQNIAASLREIASVVERRG